VFKHYLKKDQKNILVKSYQKQIRRRTSRKHCHNDFNQNAIVIAVLGKLEDFKIKNPNGRLR
jgi:hypothetical protein